MGKPNYVKLRDSKTPDELKEAVRQGEQSADSYDFIDPVTLLPYIKATLTSGDEAGKELAKKVLKDVTEKGERSVPFYDYLTPEVYASYIEAKARLLEAENRKRELDLQTE